MDNIAGYSDPWCSMALPSTCTPTVAARHLLTEGCLSGYLWLPNRVHLTVGNRPGYRGNQPYRSGSVRKKLGYRSLTEPSKS
jgi:hypothetical protein